MVTFKNSEGVIVQDRKIMSALRGVENLCKNTLPDLNNVLNVDENFFDYDEEGKVLLEKNGLLKILRYVNLVSAEMGLNNEQTTEIWDRIISAVKVLEKYGFSDSSEEGKIKEVFSWARK
jgi:hypothetical protein